MNLMRLFCVAAVFLFSSFSVFSIGLYDSSGEFNFYVSSQDPQINISIINPEGRYVFVESIAVNDYTPFLINEEVLSASQKIYSYNLSSLVSDFVSAGSGSYEVVFNAKEEDGTRLEYIGNVGTYTPTVFGIEFNDDIPQLIYPQILSGGNRVFVFTPSNTQGAVVFSKPIANYEIYVNGELFSSYTEQSRVFGDYKTSFEIFFPVDSLKEGKNEVRIDFEDIYGVASSEIVDAYYRSVDVEIDLLTRADDSSLDYYFDSRHPGLFQDKLYFKEMPLNVKVRTNTAAICYVMKTLTGFKYLSEIKSDPEVLSSSDGITHTAKFEPEESKKLWIACENKNYPLDVAHLSIDILNKTQLISMEEYDQDFDIEYIVPENTVTQTPFDIQVKTSGQGICYADYGEGEMLMNASSAYNLFSLYDVSLADGTYNVKYRCFDKVYNLAQKTQNLRVDSTAQPMIAAYSPKMTASSSASILVTLSEDISCGYSKEQKPASHFVESYSSLPKLLGEGLVKTMSVSGLLEGKNKFYLYCNNANGEEGGELFSLGEYIEIIYDSRGPVLSNLTFMNNGIASEYLSSASKIEIDFDEEYIIDIEKYFVEVQYSNYSTVFERTSKPRVLPFGNYTDAETISVIAQNELGINSSRLSGLIKFDLEEPVISVSLKGDYFTISCVDAKSGCTDIKYGFSDSSDLCTPRLDYETGENIKKGNAKFVCVNAFDGAGNIAQTVRSISSLGFGEAPSPEDVNGEQEGEEDLTGDESDEQEFDDPFESSDFEDIPKDSGNGLIIAALALAFVTLGGTGSYYAYRKGYLDTQLEKFGILKEHKEQMNKTQKDFVAKQAIEEKQREELARSALSSKSSYDSHLHRLNKFIDETLKEGDDLFDTFKDTGKGNVKKYEDTLIGSRKPKNITKDEFDEFYVKSSSRSGSKANSRSIEQEADEFEKYYREKKNGEKHEENSGGAKKKNMNNSNKKKR